MAGFFLKMCLTPGFWWYLKISIRSTNMEVKNGVVKLVSKIFDSSNSLILT